MNIKKMMVFFVIALVFITSAFSEGGSDFVKIAVMADTHLFSKELNPQGEAFERYMEGDRKLLHLSSELLKEAVDQILQTDCSIVIIPGDLTKDGELASHMDVASQLKRLYNSDKAVFVIDGNHDINNPHAVKYEGDRQIQTETVDPAQFRQIYWQYGYEQSVSRDDSSLSYVVEPVEWLRVIAMDSCLYDENYIRGSPQTGGAFNAQRLNWITQEIANGREKGQLIIGFMHHSLVSHFEGQETYFGEYILQQWKAIATRFADSGMHLVFTGHFHAQDISLLTTEDKNKIYDVQTGSLITYPNPYRIVTLHKTGECDIKSFFIEELEGYEDFARYSGDFVLEGIKDLLPGLLKGRLAQMGFKQDLIQTLDNNLNTRYGDHTLSEHVAFVMFNYYAGDESASQEIKNLIRVLKRSVLHPFLFLAGTIMESLSEDVPPQDNDLSMNLFE